MLYKRYHVVRSIEEAVTILARERGARLIAGGTDLMVQLGTNSRPVKSLVDISRIPDLKQIDFDGTNLQIGAAVTYQEIIDSPLLNRYAPLLVEASRQVGGPQIRHMGTIGGNIANASPAGDLLPPLYLLNARLTVASISLQRVIPLRDFILGVRQTVLQPGEVITQIHFEGQPVRSGSAFVKFGLRSSQAISVVSVAASIHLSGGRVDHAALTLGAVAPTVVESQAVQSILSGQVPEEARFAMCGEAVTDEISPIDDIRGAAVFRRHLIKPLVERCLTTAYRRACIPEGEVGVWPDPV